MESVDIWPLAMISEAVIQAALAAGMRKYSCCAEAAFLASCLSILIAFGVCHVLLLHQRCNIHVLLCLSWRWWPL